jgi:hypothetical protein
MTRPKYDRHFATNPRACGDPLPEFVEALKALGQGGAKRISDLGCGQGRDTLLAAEQGNPFGGVRRLTSET